MLEMTTPTVNKWVNKGTAPDGFPPPICEFGPKTRLWLPLEIRAYAQPSLYGDLEAQIRRCPVKRKSPKKVTHHKTMAPLPRR